MLNCFKKEILNQKYTYFMISKNQIKLITGLHQKKYRHQHQLFIAEGEKVILEFINAGYTLEYLFVTEYINSFESIAQKELIAGADLNKISCLTTANNCLAVFKIPTQKPISNLGLKVILDDLQDPGNLGTIIRLCDWFGISDLICSTKTVDLYNPKVVQATMGSMARITVTYCDIADYIKKSKLLVFGTFMGGENIYKQQVPENALLILGNEGNGISEEIEKLVTNKIAIPRFGALQKTESLNVASAAAIFLSEFKRNY